MAVSIANRILLLLSVTVVLAGGTPGLSQELRETFEEPGPMWETVVDGNSARVVNHSRRVEPTRDHSTVEQIIFEANQDRTAVQLDWPLTPCRVLDEFTASVWLCGNRAGAAISLRLTVADALDPDTGQPLSVLVTGDSYTTPNKWQKLSCRTFDKLVQEKLVLLRARHRQPINPQQISVTAVLISAKLPQGAAVFQLDDLHVAPMVAWKADGKVDGTIDPAHPPKLVAESPPPSVEFRLDRLTVAGRPYFPRIVRDHGESVELLRQLGVNVVWVDGPFDSPRVQELRKGGLWVTATPPQPRGSSGETLSAGDAGLPPFGAESNGVLFWMIGTRIPGRKLAATNDWIRQIQAADRQLNRPIAADVNGEERSFSRQLQMLGLSRHVLHSSLGLCEYRDWLAERKLLARPGTFNWTWIQAEGAAAPDVPVCVEPEQLRLQVYAALCSGMRGIGYWTTAPFADPAPVSLVSLDSGSNSTSTLNNDSPRSADLPVTKPPLAGSAERRLILQQLNLELSLMEPWLATAGSVQRVPVQIAALRPKVATPLGKLLKGSKSTQTAQQDEKTRLLAARYAEQAERELSAAVIRGDLGTLVLPMWLESRSQFCPGQLAANDAILVIPGGDEFATAWEISTTGIRSLHRERVPGGVQVTLNKFDQTAMIMLTSDRELVGELRDKIAGIQELSAKISVELADAKLLRVQAIDHQMRSLGHPLADGVQLLAAARMYLENARHALKQTDFHGARTLAADSLQLVRILQRAHWDDAIRRAGSPMATPYTVAFQTLPLQEQFMQRWRTSRLADQGANKLPSGTFEDLDALIVEGWRHECAEIPGVTAGAELFPEGHGGQSSLRLASQAVETAESPTTSLFPAVKITTPPVTVHAGQLVSIRGWVKVAVPIQSVDGFLMQDSLLGKAGAWRYHQASGWQRFEVLREVHQSGEITLSMQLFGIGDVQVDDLQIVPLNAPPIQAVSSEQPAEKSPRGNRFDFLPGFPKRTKPADGGR